MMQESKIKGKRKWISPLMIVGIILVMVFTYLLVENKKTMENIQTLETGWVFAINGQETKRQPGKEIGAYVFPQIDKGDVITLSRKFSEQSAPNKLISFDTWHVVTTVYLEGKSLYTWGDSYRKEGKMLGTVRHNITLPSDFQGKELVLELVAAEENPLPNIPYVAFYEAGDEGALWIGRPVLFLLGGSLILLFGVAVVIISCFGSFENKYLHEPMMLGVSIFIAGIYILCRGNFIQLLIGNPQIYNTIEYISLFTTPIPMMLYFRKDVVRLAKTAVVLSYHLCLCLSCIFILVALFLNFNTTIHLCNVLPVHYVLVLWVAIIHFYIYIKNGKKSEMKQKHIYFSGIITFIAGAMVSIIAFRLCYNGFIAELLLLWKWYNYILPTAMCILVCFFLRAFYVDMKQIIDNSYRAEMLDYLVHYDVLTRIYNRRSFEEALEEIEKIQTKEYGIISVDLNGLKQVNDTYGHQAGDEMIRSFAYIFSQCCGKNNKAYRLGGDEFGAIIYEADKEMCECILYTMQAQLDIYNKESKKFVLAVAGGTALRSEGNTLAEVLELADQRMYKNKRSMKEKGDS